MHLRVRLEVPDLRKRGGHLALELCNCKQSLRNIPGNRVAVGMTCVLTACCLGSCVFKVPRHAASPRADLFIVFFGAVGVLEFRCGLLELVYGVTATVQSYGRRSAGGAERRGGRRRSRTARLAWQTKKRRRETRSAKKQSGRVHLSTRRAGRTHRWRR